MQTGIIDCRAVAKTTGPYSCGTRVSFGEGEIIFISGQVAEDVDGNVVAKGDITRQTEQVLQNMGKVLAAAGGSPANVVKVTVFLRNMEDRGAVADVRRRFFRDNLPASTLVEVNKLAHPNWLIEMEAVAVVPRKQ